MRPSPSPPHSPRSVNVMGRHRAQKMAVGMLLVVTVILGRSYMSILGNSTTSSGLGSTLVVSDQVASTKTSLDSQDSFLEDRSVPSFVNVVSGGDFDNFDELREMMAQTAPDEAFTVSSAVRVEDAHPHRDDFVSLVSLLGDWKRNEAFEAVEITETKLRESGIPHIATLFKVGAEELPVYSEAAEDISVSSGEVSAEKGNVLRFVHRGDFLISVSEKQLGNMKWAVLGPDEVVPMTGPVKGLPGSTVHLRFDMKLDLTAVLNLRPLEVDRRTCAWTQDPKKRPLCFRMMHIVVEARRILRDYNLLQVRNVATQEVVSTENTPFEKRMQILISPKTESEMCSTIEFWTVCTQRPKCTWLYLKEIDEFVCRLDSEVKYPILPSDAMSYDPAIDFKDDRWDRRKYFVYQPSGGLNNQRIQMELAVVICKILKRTCVLPHIAQHTNFYYRYNLHHAKKMISAQRIFDMKRLKQVADVVTVPENETLMEWAHRHGAGPYLSRATKLKADTTGWKVIIRDARKIGPTNRWKDKDIKRLFHDDKSRFLFFANASMWKTIDLSVVSPMYVDVKDALTYTTPFKRLAISFANEIGEAYNAIHVRRGDKRVEAAFDDVARDANYFGTRMLPVSKRIRKLYVATDERNQTYFDPLREMGFQLITYRDFDQEKLNAFTAMFPPTMYLDIVGILEQLICSFSYRFLGCPYSTFTLYILRMRQHFPLLSQTYFEKPLQTSYHRLPMVFENFTSSSFESACNPYTPATHNKPC